MFKMYISGHVSGYDGVNLFYRGWIPQEPRGFLILIHGAGEHSGRYSHIGEICMEHDLGVLAPDLRGFGKSGGPRGHVNKFTDYLDDLNQLIESFQAQYHSAPLFIFGHSLGGLIAIRYGQIYPHKAKGFILSSPALQIRFRLPLLLKKTVEFCSWISPNLSIQPFKWLGILKKIRWLDHYLPEPDVEIFADPLFTFEYTPRWLTELTHNGMHALLDTAKFRFPLLCLYDQQDPIVHSDTILRFFNSISVQDKKYVMYEDGLHRHWDANQCEHALENVMTWLTPRL